MATEELTTALGQPGKFQVLLIALLCINNVIVSWNHLGMAFFGAKTKHHCSVQNSSDIDRLVPLVEKNGKEEWDGCRLYKNFNSSDKVQCLRGWTYYLSERERTIISEWDLVCDESYKTNLATTIYFIGVTMGGIIFGTLSDKCGRRSIFIVTMISTPLIGLVLFFMKDYIGFVVFRLILGAFIQGLQMTAFLCFMEIQAVRYRTVAAIVWSSFWPVGVMSLALVSYLIQDWRYIQLLTTLWSILQVGIIFFLPESIRWLLIKGRSEQAKLVVQKIATFNKKPFPEKEFNKAVENSRESLTNVEKSYTIVDLLKYPVLRTRSLILWMAWFSISFGYYGLALNVSNLAGNKYLNFFISGVLEFGMVWLITFVVLAKFGRRKPMSFYAFVGGITCILAGVLSKDTDVLKKLTTAFALCGRVFIAGIWTIIFIYTSELYPTVIRNVGLGAGIFWARVGGIVAPQFLQLGKKTHDYVPIIIFGSLVLLTGIFTLFLPETLNMKLAETIDEAGVFEKATDNPSRETKQNNDEKDAPRVGTQENVVSINDERV